MEYIRAELKPTRVVGAATTVVVVGRGLLGSIRLNAVSGAISVFDGLTPTGTAIAVIVSGTLVLGHNFDYVMANGITIQSTVANSDYTVTTANN